ncbi:MAG TPA: fructosamine kinase family protein [Acidimicrobiales bacterium]
MIDPVVAEAIGSVLGAGVRTATPVGGGESSDAWRIELDDATLVFAKTNTSALPGLFATEADGLSRLAATATVRVPRVLAVDDDGPTRFVVLNWIEPGRPDAHHDDELGGELADLHRTTAPRFGLDRDTITGRRRQPNAWCDTWAELYGEYRLRPTLRLAVDAGRLTEPTADRVEQVITRLPELVGPAEPPALIHGDLWAGNALVDSDGRPWLIDPAVSFSHREMDLAMMRLFGGFGPGVFAAYEARYPLLDGWRDRVELYQLFPLLVHTLHPSPAAYVGAVNEIARHYA